MPAEPASQVQPNPLHAGGEPLVALYRGVSPVSLAVRGFTRSVYSHAGLRLADGSIIESWHRGGVAHNESLGEVHTPGTVVDLFRVALPVEWDSALVFAFDQLGKGYDWRGIVRFITRRTPDCNPKRWFCSSLVFAAIEHGGVKLLERICPAEVAPALLRLATLLKFVRTEVTTAPEKVPVMLGMPIEESFDFAGGRQA